MTKKQTIQTLFLVSGLTILLLTSCGTTSKVYIPSENADDIQTHARKVLSPEELKHFSVPYMLTDELKGEAASLKNTELTIMQQARAIAQHLVREDMGGLGITYSASTNYDAKGVYEHREANCISYTNLFVGLARRIGIPVNYIEVTEVDTFSKVNGTVVYNSHICAVVHSGTKRQIIDFSMRDHPQYHSWRTISDLEAAASFYNNVGSTYFLENTGADAYKMAELYYTIARKLYPDFAPVYNNLGVLAHRAGDLEEAKRMYYRCLELKPGYFAPYQNLASIHRQNGDLDGAIEIMQKAVESEPRNQYAFTSLARMLMKKQRYAEAELNLKKALALKEDLAEAHHTLSKIYIITGRHDLARSQLELALKYDAEDSVAKDKMEMIERLAIAKMQVH